MSVLLAIGTYSQKLNWVDGKGKGVYIVSLNETNGELAMRELLECGQNPTFLCTDEQKRNLYVVNEFYEADSLIYSYSLDHASGKLAALNTASSKGGACCFDVVDPSGAFLLSANYMTGSFIVLRRDPNGALIEPATSFVEFPISEASGVVADRQERPHAHHVYFHPSAPHIFFIVDLGTDSVRSFTLDPSTGATAPLSSFQTAPGSGPRHVAIHPTLSLLYVVTELDNTVAVHHFDVATGSAKHIQTVSTLPADNTQPSWCAAIRLSADARHLYVSNRGHDSIAIFDVAADGSLTLATCVPCQGKCPRDIQIVGDWLIAANQNSSQLASFRIDSTSGALSFSGHTLECPTPAAVCPL